MTLITGDIPKFHGAMRMWTQIIAAGDGTNWNSSHRERFHQEYLKINVELTQGCYASLIKQMANRQHQVIISAVASVDQWFNLVHTPYVEDMDQNVTY